MMKGIADLGRASIPTKPLITINMDNSDVPEDLLNLKNNRIEKLTQYQLID